MFFVERDGKKYIDENIVLLIENGSNDKLVSMLQNVNPQDIVASSGATLLHLSSLYDNYLLTQFLIKWGADVNAQNEQGDTPLTIAAYNMHFDQAKLLLDANADFRMKNFRSMSALTLSIDQWHRNGPCQSILESIFDKLKEGQPNIEDTMEALISAGCQLSDVLYFKQLYSKQIMQLLLQKKNYDVNSRNERNGNTILHTAAIFNDLDLIKELLLLGADITLENNAFHIPVVSYIDYNQDQNQEIVNLLMPKEYNWAGVFPYGWRRLKIRIILIKGNKETLKIFHERSKVDMKAKDAIGQTPLHYLIHNDHKGILEQYEDAEFDVNARDYKFRRSAIHYADSLESIQFLLNRGAVLDYIDRYGDTPLMLLMQLSAVLPGHHAELQRSLRKEYIQLLMLHGANAQIININQNTVISVAIRLRAHTEVEPVLAHLALLEVTGEKIIPLIRQQIDSDEQIKDRYNLYKQQLEDMKTDHICQSITVFDILSANEKKATLYARSHAFRDKYVNKEFNFNSYFVALLKKGFNRLVEIFDMRHKVIPILGEIFNSFNLDYVVLNEIVNYLDYNNLQIFFS